MLSEEKYDLAKGYLIKMEQILGENNAEVLRAKVSYELEVCK